MDSFLAARKVGLTGSVTGVDMTDEQLEKARNLAAKYKFENISFVKGYIEHLPFEAETFDVVISNGVINLSAEKEKVFSEISRVLKPTGRMVIADIISEKQLPETITCDSTLWASCIGGAEQEDSYRQAIEKSGLEMTLVRNNSAYHFISIPALGATKRYGVKSVSLVAEKRKG
jgi:arsenite methyltransferase